MRSEDERPSKGSKPRAIDRRQEGPPRRMHMPMRKIARPTDINSHKPPITPPDEEEKADR